MLLQITAATAQPRNIVFKKLDNYFLGDRAGLSGDITCKVITKEKEFDKTFGVAKTMTNKIERPDFATQQVVMIAMQPTNKDTRITILSALKAGNYIEVFFKTSKDRFPLPYTTQPMSLAIIPKFKEVTKVKFYEGKRLVEEVGVK
ncbi:MAG: hypothetical protein P4L41_03345 [Flavipsychrobacter sp.]|nr:hypothetical protein [Flavipsychrobacter sp.]